MRKSLLVLWVGLLGSALLIPALAAAHDGAAQPTATPQPATTVSPAGPNEDYKGNPAPDEAVAAPDGEVHPSLKGLTIADAHRKLDPHNDPSILICQRKDGSFEVGHVRWASPAAAAAFQKSKNKKAFGLINDGGPCDE